MLMMVLRSWKVGGVVEDCVRRVGAVLREGKSGMETLFVNAALEGSVGILEKEPWLVELELDAA